MGRPASHDADSLLDAAVRLVAVGGPAAVTMSAVAREASASSGSVYHRFPGLPALQAGLWLRTLGRFQEGELAALAGDPPAAAAPAAAGHVVRWSAEHPGEAGVLLAGPRAFGADGWPPAAVEAAGRARAALDAAVADLRHRLGLPADADPDPLLLAVVDLPYAVVRRYLSSGRPVPPAAADLVERAAAAVLAPLTP